MIRKQLKMILSICTFLVLFHSSMQQFPLFSIELSSNEGSSSSSSNESKAHILKLAEKVAELKPLDRKMLIKDFLAHLLALSKLQEDERKVEFGMLMDLETVPKFEFDAMTAIKKFRKAIDEGRKKLDRIIEKRKNKTSSGGPEVLQHYQNTWIQMEVQKRDEAKSALETIDNILSSFGKSIVGTVDEQLKTLQGIQKIIVDRKKKIDEESGEIRKHLQSIQISKIPISTQPKVSPTPADSAVFLFDENDVKEIRHIYDLWTKRLPQIDIPETKRLLKKIEQSGMSLPLFCKTLAESHVIRRKARACEKKGDMAGVNVLVKTLEQPNYKKVEEIIEDSPPPSLEAISKVFKEKFGD